MELILLEKVTNLGDLGDKVNVKAGFGRNYLLPQGKAVVATAEKIAEFEVRRVEFERKAAGELSEVVGAIAINVDKRNRFHRFRSRAHVVMAAAADVDR